MVKEAYKHLFDQVQPRAELLSEILNVAENSGKRKRIMPRFVRPLTAMISICLCLSLALPALASTVEPIYQLMYLVSPGIAQFFMPVQKLDEDNGIKMEVVSAFIHDDTAEIYITMQDLTEDRIDGTTDLYDSYDINCPFDSAANCQRVGYDEKTKTATFLITITQWGKQKITGDKITFSVREFLSHKKTYKDVEIPVDLSTVTAGKTQDVHATGGGGTNSQELADDGIETVLLPGQAMSGFPIDGIDLTAMGYINGRLHVQMALHDRLATDNHGYFYLKDADGNKINSDYSVYFTNQYENQADRIDYCECVFMIPQEKIGAYTLNGDFMTSGLLTQGNWRVTFSLERGQ